jgi:hypothetical protein
MTKEIRSTKFERTPAAFPGSLGLRASSFLRHSSFGFRHSGAVGSTPTRATGREQHASVGHWQASVAVTHSPLAMQVQLLPDALIEGKGGAVRCWFCSEAFNLAHAGSIPVRVTEDGQVVEFGRGTAGHHAQHGRWSDAQKVVPARACEFNSRLGYWRR